MTDNLSRIEVEILNLIYKKDYENDLEVKINESNLSLTEAESSKRIHEGCRWISIWIFKQINTSIISQCFILY
ncbi:hypothetical protein [Halanaerobium salsuginis]|uniref:hypothetical protein n=1 Tax=Halanaerobium salsuginis TaxID=29563 RepID=UPI000B7EA32F|nr:hypothetical protein [Halanaerobium salsuginis]